MDPQVRQAGFGDPSLGKQVRMMVGSLAAKVDQWRLAGLRRAAKTRLHIHCLSDI